MAATGFFFGVHLFLLGWMLFPHAEALTLGVAVDDKANYNVTLDGVPYLRSAPVILRANGKMYTSGDGSLKLVNVTRNDTHDVYGPYLSYVMQYQADDVHVTATIRDYSLNFVTFTLKYETAANQTSTGRVDDVISAFPGFQIETALKELGYISYGGENLGITQNVAGKWAPGEATLQGGLQGSSPLAVFDKSGKTVIVSALDNFLSTLMWQDTNANQVHWGIMGGVDNVPQAFEYSTVIISDDGIGSAFNVWGFFLTNTFYKANNSQGTDCPLSKLGYWTDKNWAYYGKPSGTYEDTVVKMAAVAKNNSLPIGYMQLDDWWYTKGKGNGVKQWEAPASILPNGVQSINNLTQLPVALRSDVWSSDTNYAIQNGGRYTFVIEGDYSIPNDQAFWDEMLTSAKSWGVSILDQESMSDQLQKMNITRKDLFLARDWMRHMGASLDSNDVSVVFGSATPRQAMQVLDLRLPKPSSDVISDEEEEGYGKIKIRQQLCSAFRIGSWRIGVPLMWARALPAQFMVDVFQTRANVTGISPKLMSLVASLAAGPIGIGDGEGSTNRPLLMRSLGNSGKILKYNQPIAAVDAQVLKMAFGGDGPDGEVWTAVTSVEVEGMAANTALVYGVVFGINTGPYKVFPKDARMDFELAPSQVFSYKDPNTLSNFDNQTPLTLENCTMEDFCLHYVAPIITFKNKKVLILGELDKWVPVSRTRMQKVKVTADQIIVTMQVPPGERVELWFWMDGHIGALARIADAVGGVTIVYETGPFGGDPPQSAPSPFALLVVLVIAILAWARQG